MGTEIKVYEVPELTRMAQAVAKSGLFGIKDESQALALMLVAQAEGKHPATVARDYDIIQGRPAKKSEAMLRDLIAAGGGVEWHALDDGQADATFSHAQGGSVRIKWDMERATRAGLAGKDNWKRYPRAMLRSRCVSEGCRTVAPFVTSGSYTPEEVQDIVEQEKDVTPVSQAVAVAQATNPNALTETEIADHLAAIDSASDQETLRAAFGSAYRHAKDATDEQAKTRFQTAYNQRKAAQQAAA